MATAVITSAVVGSIVYSPAPSCSTVIINGFAYQQCGTVWYQPQISGGSTTYIVVNPPRSEGKTMLQSYPAPSSCRPDRRGRWGGGKIKR